ncbi:type II toxin-antitoxin system Phd/YefM family antitoxin [Acinetobacter baumannii]|uniref:type II toxin-antitoxin system Phd/YefM family antitoxin n=1 Tax=Acinetobacter baumannii TaxID=470 RepID=UPI0021BD242C|nr:type II toxin-antitoxin system Phd/YefM family antitoxin [Acinetobacter baumannii]EKT8702793.1 type II toxin-antitoxin system Phd/YefM family antitoxin [Acinetobacter baumannii]EKV2134206.1 type II toxin-antitoxin system Phd/YefM family antitoxin [Acinetobacter baumannii]MCT9186746.1 type II toxin-antitoxin system Phd/YefM family antitoxin [Acinetobacter baumannii]MCT9290833.1 type II toxin-antitoxin system Phd/YefM family antitoxin [Acinetobacter baumannii]
MNKWNYSNARAQLTMIMDQAVAGHPIEITRRGRESAVVISKASYEAYRQAVYDVAYYKISTSKDNSEA